MSRKLSARSIARLRKRISKFEVFIVSETSSLFGDFFGSKEHIITAQYEQEAINRYMKKYRRNRKKRSNNERDFYYETSEMWGHIKVVDKNGFKKFYK